MKMLPNKSIRKIADWSDEYLLLNRKFNWIVSSNGILCIMAHLKFSNIVTSIKYSKETMTLQHKNPFTAKPFLTSLLEKKYKYMVTYQKWHPTDSYQSKCILEEFKIQSQKTLPTACNEEK